MTAEETSVVVELDTPNGPRVVVSGEIESEDVEAQLPERWTVGDNWHLGVKLGPDRWSYPLVRERGRPVSTGAGKAKLVAFRPTAAERTRLEAEAAALGISVGELAKRRTLGLPEGGPA